MKTLQISDEAYEALKTFIIDPFDDTPEQLIVRLMEIANKARQRWSPFDNSQATHQPTHSDPPHGTRVPNHTPDTMEVVL
ncbi:hypothetical protein ACFL6U_07525 [Planctomycetota bacterium]